MQFDKIRLGTYLCGRGRASQVFGREIMALLFAARAQAVEFPRSLANAGCKASGPGPLVVNVALHVSAFPQLSRRCSYLRGAGWLPSVLISTALDSIVCAPDGSAATGFL